MKNLIFIVVISFVSIPVLAFSSSSFLISQLAFKNYDFNESLSNFETELNIYSEINLLNKIIAAVIIEDLSQANKIANKLILNDKDNQEAYIVKLVYMYSNKKFDEIRKFHQEAKNKNELIDFIFFNNNELKDKTTISNSLIDIVTSSFSNVDQQSLNYNFLLFYTSLSKIIDNKNERAILIKGELFQNIEKYELANKLFQIIKPSSPFYIDAQRNLAFNYSYNLSYEDAENKSKVY